MFSGKRSGPFLFFKSIQKTFQLKSRSPKSISGEEEGKKRFGPHIQLATHLCVSAIYRVSSCVRILFDFPRRSGLERSLQTMKGAPGTGRGSRFTCVGGEVYAAVDGIVVLVGR